MTSIARYATLQLRPYSNRSEHINYGVLVFEKSNDYVVVEAQVAPVANKVKSFAPHISFAELQSNAHELAKHATNKRFENIEHALDWFHVMNLLRDSKADSLGAFKFRDIDERQTRIDMAITSLCNTSKPRKISRNSKSRLFYDLRDQFKAVGILALKGMDLPDHQVVEHYAPEPSTDVRVEFALQNGMLRIAQTVDLRSDDELSAQQRNAVLSKAFALTFASQVLNPSSLQTWLICAGARGPTAERLNGALEKQANNVVHWEDKNEMEYFMTTWAHAAGKELPSLPMH
jgi:hypothetical protein